MRTRSLIILFLTAAASCVYLSANNINIPDTGTQGGSAPCLSSTYAYKLLPGERDGAMEAVRATIGDSATYRRDTRQLLPGERDGAMAAVRTTPEDSVIYHRTMQRLLPLAGRPVGELMTAAAKALSGTPYKGGTLESVPEVLTVNLHETDCILFVETCTAMTIILKKYGNYIPPFSRFCDIVRSLRYRNGEVDGYASRLHYTSEWLLQAEDEGILYEITEDIGGIPLNREFSFMSSHPDNYPQLREDDVALELIRRTEKRLDTTAVYFYIPAERIPETEDNIQDGDIICFVSAVPGLDITHTGIACRTSDGELHFIHASMKEGEVVLETRTLASYARTGIRVTRMRRIQISE